MGQLILHLLGDYITQSHWMAENKTKRDWPAYAHALIYAAPFFLLTGDTLRGQISWVTIFLSHFLIDRYRLARYVVWAKNHLAPVSAWTPLTETGYPETVPAWLSGWLLIVADNTLHLSINYAALRWL